MSSQEELKQDKSSSEIFPKAIPITINEAECQKLYELLD